MQRLLFVDPDHGSRSQMAEALFRHIREDLGLRAATLVNLGGLFGR
jgi:protein-tyrosine-phosphatase